MIDFIIDLETFGSSEKAAVVDLSVIAFDPDPTKIETFSELVKRGKRIKFDLNSQRGQRLFSTSTINWWKKQSPEARKNLAPTANDVHIFEGYKQLIEYLKDAGVSSSSLGYCRGQSFDFPILTGIIRDYVQHTTKCKPEDIDTFNYEPVKFWNQRDIRTAIESLLLTRGLTTCPLKVGVLDTFIKHDSIHDCAKDILMLKYAQRYALGLEEAPSKEDTDPLSI